MRKFDELCALQFWCKIANTAYCCILLVITLRREDKFSMFECQELHTRCFRFVDGMSEN